MTNRLFNRSVLAEALPIAFAIAALAPALAFAQDGAPTAQVRIGDLDLTSAEGVATMDRRLQGAVRRVCPLEEPGAGAFMLHRECVAYARDSFTPQRVAMIAAAGRRAQLGAISVAGLDARPMSPSHARAN